MDAPNYIRDFESLGLEDVALVGGKTASLGELSRLLGASKCGVVREAEWGARAAAPPAPHHAA